MNQFELQKLISMGTGTYLRDYMARHGLSRKGLSDISGLSGSAFNAVLGDRAVVTPSVAVRLGKFCHVPWHMLMSCHSFTADKIGLEEGK